MADIALAGSTGSIGTQAIDVVTAGRNAHRIVAIGAFSSVEKLCQQAEQLRPRLVGLADPSGEHELRERLDRSIELVVGPDAMVAVAQQGDIVCNGVVGFAGLPVTIETLRSGRRLALANKESLIAGAPIVNPLRSTPGAELIPVDSEHAAIHQCLRAGRSTEVASLVLTASGGPFRTSSREELEQVTVAQALAHPTWAMGPKITVDSSTLMNKGLEVIEAHALFGTPFDDIEVVIHPQSLVHSMVTFSDGATIAQISQPTMCLPLAYAFEYPHRSAVKFGAMDFSSAVCMEFEPPRRDTFGCLELAYEAGRCGGSAPAWLSAANEVCVEAFLGGAIRWVEIAGTLEIVLGRWPGEQISNLEELLAVDDLARRVTREVLNSSE